MTARTFTLLTGKGEVNCALDEDGLAWGDPTRRATYAELRSVRLYGLPGLSGYGTKYSDPTQGCAVSPKGGKPLTIVAIFQNVDREAEFRAFVADLLQRLSAFPGVPVYWGFTRAAWFLSLFFCVVMWMAFLFIVGIGIVGVTVLFDRRDDLIGDLFGLAMVLLAICTFTPLVMSITRMLRNGRPRRLTAADKERIVKQA